MASVSGRELSERYGAGLPHVGSRPLREHERRTIRRTVRRAFIVAALTTVLPPFCIGVALTLGPLLDPSLLTTLGGSAGLSLIIAGGIGAGLCLLQGERQWRWVASIGLLYLLAVGGIAQGMPTIRQPHPWLTGAFALAVWGCGIGFLTTRARDAVRVLRRRPAIRSDLEHAAVDRFEGRLRNLREVPVFRRMLRRGELEDHGGDHSLEALCGSGCVLRVDGVRPRRAMVAFTTTIAASAPHAFRAELPAGVVVGDTSSIQLQRRSLTPAETHELGRHIRSLHRPTWLATMVFVAMLATMAWQGVEAGSPKGLLSGICLGWYGLAIVIGISHGRRIWAARKLRADRSLRWVVTVEDRGSSSSPSTPKLEILPVSQLAWTENAAPAPWRVVRV